MREEIDTLIEEMRTVLEGEPWFGRPMYAILEEIHPALVFKKPNEDAHSLIDLIYHTITWIEFTLSRVEGDQHHGNEWEEVNNWRQIDPLEHTWARALSELRELHERLFKSLEAWNDKMLDNKVEGRDYNFRFLLKGLIQHNIYHLGQVAYVKKWLIPG